MSENLNAGRISLNCNKCGHKSDNLSFDLNMDYNGHVSDSIKMNRDDALNLHYLLSRALGVTK